MVVKLSNYLVKDGFTSARVRRETWQTIAVTPFQQKAEQDASFKNAGAHVKDKSREYAAVIRLNK